MHRLRVHLAPKLWLGSGLAVASAAVASAAFWPSRTYAQQASKPVAATAANDEDENKPSDYAVSLDLSRAFPARPSHLAVRGLAIIHRHGARAPVAYLPGGGPAAPDAVPGSPEAFAARKQHFRSLWGMCAQPDGSLIPCQRGLLSQFGELQLQSLGFWLKRRYHAEDQFLPATFDPAFFYLTSTDIPRTRLSLTRLVQGAYPALTAEEIIKQVDIRQGADVTLYPNRATYTQPSSGRTERH